MDEDNSQSIPSSSITLSFWLSSSSESSNDLTYTADIKGSFYYNFPSKTAAEHVINDCDINTAWTNSSKEDRLITVNDPNRDVIVIGARAPFSFTFSTSYTVLDRSSFKIDLKFLATTNTNLL